MSTSQDIRESINKIKNLKQLVNESIKKSNEMLLFVFDKNHKVLAINIPDNNKNELNKHLYDENGNNIGGYGVQVSKDKEYLRFDTIEDAQKWDDERTESHLNKATQNKKYLDLSNIALELRKNKDIDFQVINQGSCFKFAKEVSKLGYNQFTFIFSDEEQEVIHVYIKLSGNLYWDANGFHSKIEIKNEYDLDENTYMYDGDINELDHYCSIDTSSALSTIPISAETWDKIIQIINLNKLKTDINENTIEEKFAYHVTNRKNLKSIMKRGLEPRVPHDYGNNGDTKGVYLFKTIDDTKNALYNWLGERIEEWEEETGKVYDEVVLKINIDGLEEHLIDSVEYEWTCLVVIEPSRIVEVLEM